MQQAYIEYESQSQGISSQTCDLLKLKRIAITRQLPSGEKQCLQCPARSEKQRSYICYLDRANIVTTKLTIKGDCFVF
jgi:hypothetical protein